MTALRDIYFWAVCAALFWLPGALLARWSRLFRSRIGPGEQILPAFLLSAGIYGVVYMVSMATRPTLAFASTLWAAVVILLAAGAVVEARLRRRQAAPPAGTETAPSARPAPKAARSEGSPPQETGPGRTSGTATSIIPAAPASRGSWIPVALVLLFGFVAMLIQGGNLGSIHDSLDFASFVNRMLLTGRIDLVTGAFRDIAGLAPDPRRGSFHLAAALLCRFSGFSAVEMWRTFPSFLVPLALWVFYAAFRRILGSAPAALASLLWFVAATFFTGDHFINNLAYASRLGWVYSWVGLWAVALYVDQDRQDHTPPADWRPRPDPGRRDAWFSLGLAMLGAPILVGIHVLSAAQYLISLGTLAWAWSLLKHEPRSVRRNLFRLPFGAVIALLPFLAIKLWHSYSAANPIFDHPQGLLYLKGAWPVLTPVILANWFHWPGLLAILVSFGLWRWFRYRRDRAFLAASMLVPLLIVLNPVVVKVLEKGHAHSLLFRVILVAPWFQVLGSTTVESVARLRQRKALRSVAAAVLFLALGAGAIYLHGAAAVRAWKTPEQKLAAWREPAPELRALDFLQTTVREPAVVLSDPITSYAVPAYTRHFAVTSLHQHSSPADGRSLERIHDAQTVLSAYVPLSETLRILRKYQVGYLLLNQSFPMYQAQYATFIHAAAFPEQRAKFLERPSIFEKIYDSDRVFIFRFHDPGPEFAGDGLDLPNPYEVMPPEAGDDRPRSELAAALGGPDLPIPDVGGLELITAMPDSASYARGSHLVLWTWWRRTNDPYGLPVEAFARVEAPWPDRMFSNPVLGRLWRMWYEARHHVTYRFGREFEPLASNLPPFLWPSGAVYKEGLYMSVPGWAIPGDYTIRVKLDRIPFTPNLVLSDLFRLNDSLEGDPVAHIRVR